jgi:hypothetical protein
MLIMSQYDTPFEIHVHGDIALRVGTSLEQVQETLKPLWAYTGAHTLAQAAASAYHEEPGIRFDAASAQLQMCWTVGGDLDFRQSIEEMCLGLNELAARGAAIEVSFHDMAFDEEDAGPDEQARDDFLMMFVGPTPEAILQVQRDMLADDVMRVMERHFDTAELSGVVAEIDKLFAARLQSLTESLQLGRKPSVGGSASNHGGPRRPRHLH